MSLNNAANAMVLATALLASSGCAMMRATKATGNPNEHFLVVATQMNLAEIAAGQLAVDKGSRPAVKRFGQQMIDHHSQMNEEIGQLAKRKGVALPRRPDEMHLTHAAHLEELNGAAFDQEYVSHMTGDHAKVVSLFEDKAKLATDAEVRTLAERSVPMLREHLQAAKTLGQTLGAASTVSAAAAPARSGGTLSQVSPDSASHTHALE